MGIVGGAQMNRIWDIWVNKHIYNRCQQLQITWKKCNAPADRFLVFIITNGKAERGDTDRIGASVRMERDFEYTGAMASSAMCFFVLIYQ